MRYTQLRSFHAVALTGSVTQAAHRLNVSQPTLTAQIRDLEAEFSLELFIRTPAGMILTEIGHALEQVTHRLFNEEEEARQVLIGNQELQTGHLRLGAVGPFHAIEILAMFHQQYPGVHVSVTIGNSQSVLESLLDHKTDVAILAHPERDPRLWVKQYSQDEIVVFARTDHPLFASGRTSISIKDLHDQKMVVRESGSNTRRAMDAALDAAGIRPRIIMEIGSREAMKEAVASGIGLGAISSAEITPDARICVLPFSDASIYNYAHVVCYSTKRHFSLMKAFLSSINWNRDVDARRFANVDHPSSSVD